MTDMKIEPLRVRDYMTATPLTVTADTPIMDAVALLVERDISGVIVVDANNAPVGILTERDCIRTALQAGYFDESGGRVADYMTPKIHTVGPDDSLMDVGELFADSPFRRCPVVDGGQLVGLILRRDVLRAVTQSAWFERSE
jgi:CBS domain-containing protein